MSDKRDWQADMTREEILAMKPGQELDELIAIHVMERENNRTVWGQKPFTPSRQISAAWEVAERYPIATIERVEIFVGNVEVKASLWEGFDYKEPVEVTAKTAPEAICKAALLAVMDKEAEA